MKASDKLQAVRALPPGTNWKKKLSGRQRRAGPLEKGKFFAPAWNQIKITGHTPADMSGPLTYVTQ